MVEVHAFNASNNSRPQCVIFNKRPKIEFISEIIIFARDIMEKSLV